MFHSKKSRSLWPFKYNTSLVFRSVLELTMGWNNRANIMFRAWNERAIKKSLADLLNFAAQVEWYQLVQSTQAWPRYHLKTKLIKIFDKDVNLPIFWSTSTRVERTSLSKPRFFFANSLIQKKKIRILHTVLTTHR